MLGWGAQGVVQEEAGNKIWVQEEVEHYALAMEVQSYWKSDSNAQTWSFYIEELKGHQNRDRNEVPSSFESCSGRKHSFSCRDPNKEKKTVFTKGKPNLHMINSRHTHICTHTYTRPLQWMIKNIFLKCRMCINWLRMMWLALGACRLRAWRFPHQSREKRLKCNWGRRKNFVPVTFQKKKKKPKTKKRSRLWLHNFYLRKWKKSLIIYLCPTRPGAQRKSDESKRN